MTARQRFILICDSCPSEWPNAIWDENPAGQGGHSPDAIAKHHGWETINDRAPNGEVYQVRHKCKACKE